jgi:hypothetical protein
MKGREAAELAVRDRLVEALGSCEREHAGYEVARLCQTEAGKQLECCNALLGLFQALHPVSGEGQVREATHAKRPSKHFSMCMYTSWGFATGLIARTCPGRVQSW